MIDNCGTIKDEKEGSTVDKLDESEEERIIGDDDGFRMDNERVVHDPSRRNFGPILDKWKTFKQNSSRVMNKINVGDGSFVTNEEV